MRRKAYAVLLVPVALLAVGTGAVLSRSSGHPHGASAPLPRITVSPDGSVAVKGRRIAGRLVAVTGSVVGRVGPGSPARLDVTVTNSDSRPVVVTTVRASVTSVSGTPLAGRPACSAGWYVLGTFDGARTVGAHRSSTVALPLTFVDASGVNQDSCKGATYRVAYTADAHEGVA